MPYEAISPYGSNNEDRLNNTKENFKLASRLISKYIQNKNITLLDVGCANGEFAYSLFNDKTNSDIKARIKSCIGIDLTAKFIENARSLDLESCTFICADLFEYEPPSKEQFDVVTCFGTVPIFKDPTIILEKLISFLSPKGVLICDGLFNEHEISVNIEFMDNSSEVTKGVWRSDFNQHGRGWVSEILNAKGYECEYIKEPFKVKLDKIEGNPNIVNWTEELKDGNLIIVNGTNLIVNPTMLVASKYK